MFGKKDLNNGSDNELLKKNREQKNSLFEDSEDDVPGENNYLQGALGSLIGAFAGSVLWFLIGMVGFYASIAGYAIAFCAFKGYKYMKGRFTRVAIVINIVAMLIAFLTVIYLSYFYQIHKTYPEISFSVFNMIFPGLLRDSEVLKEVLRDLALGLLFMGLGSYRVIKDGFDFVRKREANQNVQEKPEIEEKSCVEESDTKESE